MIQGTLERVEVTDRTYIHKQAVTIRHPCSVCVPVGRRAPCSVRNTFCFAVSRGLLGLDGGFDFGLHLGLHLGGGGGACIGFDVEVLRG